MQSTVSTESLQVQKSKRDSNFNLFSDNHAWLFNAVWIVEWPIGPEVGYIIHPNNRDFVNLVLLTKLVTHRLSIFSPFGGLGLDEKESGDGDCRIFPNLWNQHTLVNH